MIESKTASFGAYSLSLIHIYVAKRDADIVKVLEVHAQEFGHIPLHDQVIPWAMRKNVSVIHRADNRLVADWVKVD